MPPSLPLTRLSLSNNDPFPIPATHWQVQLSQPLASTLGLTTLPLHIHEVILAACFYHFIYLTLSPLLSRQLFPKFYHNFNHRTRINWDIHVVALIQAIVVTSSALWVMWNDGERSSAFKTSEERVWGYTGAQGMIQAFATGYFFWDLCICIRHVNIFGLGLLAHAVAALTVFGFGFRPFVNYYGAIFIQYELSSIFLNIHWILDKIDMTGTRTQWYNGILLLGSFFACRLIYGMYQSVRVFTDVYRSVQYRDAIHAANAVEQQQLMRRDGVMQYSGNYLLPDTLVVIYLVSNIVLNTLNYFWFSRMVGTVMKRFKEPRQDRAESSQRRQKQEDGVLVQGLADSSTFGKVVVDGVPAELLPEQTVQVKVDGEAKSSTVEVGKRGARRRG